MEQKLTDGEWEIAVLVADDATHREIALATRLSEHTVRTHVQNIYTKLDIHSKVALTNRVRDRTGTLRRQEEG
ncbi:MAG: LuxR C-terminal-related transcriptional regulator [Chloroflexi bacterium]|nr:LuxR C-terminal-related transcriptional regulator [Chloroflexota bacterium]